MVENLEIERSREQAANQAQEFVCFFFFQSKDNVEGKHQPPWQGSLICVLEDY